MEKVFSKCGMRCDLCLIYRPNVTEHDQREEICKVFQKVYPGYNPDPKKIFVMGAHVWMRMRSDWILTVKQGNVL